MKRNLIWKILIFPIFGEFMSDLGVLGPEMAEIGPGEFGIVETF